MATKDNRPAQRWLLAGCMAALMLVLGLSAWNVRTFAARPPDAATLAGAPGIVGPIVIKEEKHDISPPVRDLYAPPVSEPRHEIEIHRHPWVGGPRPDVDAVVQRT